MHVTCMWCRFVEGQIDEGGGKEIRCPEVNCFQIVPDVSYMYLASSCCCLVVFIVYLQVCFAVSLALNCIYMLFVCCFVLMLFVCLPCVHVVCLHVYLPCVHVVCLHVVYLPCVHVVCLHVVYLPCVHVVYLLFY